MSDIGFIAYPGSKPLVRDSIINMVESTVGKPFTLRPWEKLDSIGFKLDDLIRSQIVEASVLIADITYANPNVYYELGYAIAVGKPVLPCVNVAIEKALQQIQQTGIFDTIGWATYSNSTELLERLNDWSKISWTNNYVRRRNHGQPLFIQDSFAKIDFRNHIFQTVDNSQVKYRSFDPEQVPRLTAAQAIADISASAGVIIPILSDDIVDAHTHNLRGAFLLGLSHGYSVETLAIQYGNGPIPLDYRDFVRNSTSRRETERHVGDFAAQVLVWNQEPSARDSFAVLGLLNEIDLGSPTAENETQSLSYYFVETAEYARALRAEGSVVIGRKGSGKTAVSLQIALQDARDRNCCVVDLRPASHQLSEMREAVLSVVSSGVFDHTIAAFWQYIVYVEILLKLREMAIPQAKQNVRILQRVQEIDERFSLGETVVSGDFTSRLSTAVTDIIRQSKKAKGEGDLRQQLTNLMFEEPIPALRDAIMQFSSFASDVVVLIDDLDKGWPPRQVEPHDILIIKHLIEALNRVRRDLGKRKLEVKHLVFLRSDIYEALIEQTSDRGKYNVIKVDWSDPEQLRHLLKQRVISGIERQHHQAAWDSINPTLSDGRDAVSHMIDGSLRRPRFLIDLCERALSFAVNRGHSLMLEDDVREAMRQMSLYLVSDFGYEMRDRSGIPHDIFYSFIGKPELLTEIEIEAILRKANVQLTLAECIDLFLWYGFLGVVTEPGHKVFIYERAYDFRRLQGELNSNASERLYAVNRAFLTGLEAS